MADDYENIDEFYPNKKCKKLIVSDDMIADMFSKEKLYLIVKKLFIRGRKLNICLSFMTKSYFTVPKHHIIMKILSKELQQIPINHFPDIDFKEFLSLYKKSIAEKKSFLVNDSTL